jgi:hypothetical protein
MVPSGTVDRTDDLLGDRLDLDDVVADAQPLCDRLRIGHVLGVVDRTGHHQPVQAVHAECLHREMRRGGAVDPARQPQHRPVGAGCVHHLGDEGRDRRADVRELIRPEAKVQRCIGQQQIMFDAHAGERVPTDKYPRPGRPELTEHPVPAPQDPPDTMGFCSRLW